MRPLVFRRGKEEVNHLFKKPPRSISEIPRYPSAIT